MPATRPNPRLAKIHRNYTVDEIARLYGVHRNTVRSWIKGGLRALSDQRPALVLGRDLADFLRMRRAAQRRPCGQGEMYCLRCRAPRAPADRQVIYQPLTPTQGNLVGQCIACGTKLFRRVSLAKLAAVERVLHVRGAPNGPEKPLTGAALQELPHPAPERNKAPAVDAMTATPGPVASGCGDSRRDEGDHRSEQHGRAAAGCAKHT